MTTSATETGHVAASALAEILARAVGGRPVAEYAEGEPIAWSVVDQGGWDLIGVPEEHDGGGAALRDLVEMALVWGQGCAPLPLLESVWAKRWSTAARECGRPVTVSVRRPSAVDGSGMAPYGGWGDVLVARSVAAEADILETPDGGVSEVFAPSLRMVVLGWTSTVPVDAARELGVLWAAEAVGAAQRLVDLSVDYAKQRVQFDKPIGSFQAVKHRLADMHSEVQLAETAVIWASLEADHSHRAARYALDSTVKIAESAIQVHGAMGFTWEMGLHYYLRSVLARRELTQGLWSARLGALSADATSRR